MTLEKFHQHFSDKLTHERARAHTAFENEAANMREEFGNESKRVRYLMYMCMYMYMCIYIYYVYIRTHTRT